MPPTIHIRLFWTAVQLIILVNAQRPGVWTANNINTQLKPTNGCPTCKPQRQTRSSVGCGMQAPQFLPYTYQRKSRGKRLIGGEQAKAHSWPWATTFEVEGLPAGKYIRNGVLVRVRDDREESDIVLTVAHIAIRPDTWYSTPQLQPINKIRVIAGKHNLNENDGYDQISYAANVRIHPSYKGVTFPSTGNLSNYIVFFNNIAIVKLITPIKFNDAVRPVCLPPSNAPIPVGQKCVAASWGRNNKYINSPSAFSQTLDQMDVPIYEPSVCHRGFTSLYVEQQMICGGDMNGNRGMCNGDSGSMLACQETDGRWTSHGLNSWGAGYPDPATCIAPNRLGIWNRVSTYMDWITSTMRQLTTLK